MKRTPPSNALAPKRKLEDDFEDGSSVRSPLDDNSNLAKKLNLSISSEARKDLSLFGTIFY